MGFRSIKKKQQCFLAVLAVILAAVLILGGCKVLKEYVKADDIIILYTNDVHCAVDGILVTPDLQHIRSGVSKIPLMSRW